MDKPLWLLRPMKKEDTAFVYASWLKSFRDSPVMRNVRNTVYFTRQHDVISKIFERDFTTGIIACNPEDLNEIYGYAIAEYRGSSVIVHWVYVKFSLRNFGIAKDLLKQVSELPDIDYKLFSHMPKDNDKLLSKAKDLDFIYDPWLSVY